MKYIYTINLDKMEEVYLEHTKRDFFLNDEERQKFNVKIVVEANSEEESQQMRIGMSDIRMWELTNTELE
jgi:hypothetical protein